MFGILFFIFIALCGAAAAIWKGIDDVKIYKDTKYDFGGYYIDSKGAHRQIGNGNLVAILKDDYGDEIMYTPKGKVITNITENQRHKFIDAIKSAIHNGETNQTAYWCDLKEYHENEWAKINGCRYKDVENGNIYIVRAFDVDGLKYKRKNYTSGMVETKTTKRNIRFYMDISTGHLIRRADFDIWLEKKYPDREAIDYAEENQKRIEAFIKDFNQKQDIDIKNKGIERFEEHYYFNSNKEKNDSFLDNQWILFKAKDGVLEIEKEETKATWTH